MNEKVILSFAAQQIFCIEGIVKICCITFEEMPV